MRSRHSLWLVVLLGVGTAADARPAEDDAALAPDVKTLHEAKVGTDGPALLAFVRSHTLSDAARADLARTVRRLGDNDFDVREKASEDLVKAGRAALPFLRRALRDPDAEIARRARESLERIERGPERSLLAAAVRLLAARRPAGADQALLDYLPSSPEDYLEEAIVSALEAVGVRDGKPTAALTAALADKEPSRRGAAAHVLGRHCPGERPAVWKLLADADPGVRFRAAAALARAGDKGAVSVLVALLSEGAPETAWQAEDLLLRLAGGQAPPVALNTGSEKARKECRAAWAGWWQANEAKADLGRLDRDEPSRGLRVVCELQGARGGGRVVAFGLDDKVRWQLDDVAAPIDVQLLPNGHVLLAEINGPNQRVTERDRDGKVVFEKKVSEAPMTCLRLANGNTFIATYHEVLEVDRDGKTIYSHQRPGPSIYCAQKLRNGHILTLDAGGQITELTTDGKEVRRVPAGDTSNWGGVEIQPNGHFLVARCSKHEVVELDAAGKELWRVSIEWPTWAGRLSNGRTLVACAHSGIVAEFDRSGREVWRLNLTGRPCRLRRY